MPFTAQQLAIHEWVSVGKGNALGVARAGSGKTTTAIGAIRLMTGSVAVTSYNAEITAEIGDKVAAAGLSSDVKTAHGFGYRAWRMVHPKVRLDKSGKMTAILDALNVPKHMRGFVTQAVSLAKQRAIGIVTKMADRDAWMYLVDHHKIDACLTNDMLQAAGDERPRDLIIREGLNAACRAMRMSIEMAHEVIDFDDQIYMPLYARARIRQYDWLVVDEAQDTNPIRRLLYKAMVKPTGRILFIGDNRQAIYGFCGADNDALDIIQREFSCEVFPLTVTFRCPVTVVREAQLYVPDIEAVPGAKEGRVRRIHERNFAAETLRPSHDAVICRNTKPLVDLFYSLLKQGVPAYVEGKDEAKALARLAFRWKRIDTVSDLADKLVEFRDQQVADMIAAKREAAAEALADRVDTLLAIIDGMAPDATLDDLKARLETMFVDSAGRRLPAVALMTAHRSKGREFDRVFLWGANLLMPSRRAETEWEIEQEMNLLYVAITRAMDELVYVDIERSKKDQDRHQVVTFAEGHALAA